MVNLKGLFWKRKGEAEGKMFFDVAWCQCVMGMWLSGAVIVVSGVVVQSPLLMCVGGVVYGLAWGRMIALSAKKRWGGT